MQSLEKIYGKNSNPFPQYDYTTPLQLVVNTSTEKPYAKILETDVQLNPYKFRDGERGCTGVISEISFYHNSPTSASWIWPTGNIGRVNFGCINTGFVVGTAQLERFGNSQNSFGDLMIYSKKSSNGGTSGAEVSFNVSVWVKSSIPLVVAFPLYKEAGVATQTKTLAHNAYTTGYTRAREAISNVDSTALSSDDFQTAVNGFSKVDSTADVDLHISSSVDNFSLQKHTERIIVDASSSTVTISRVTPAWDSGDINYKVIDIISKGTTKILHTNGTATEITGNNIKCPGDQDITMSPGQIVSLQRFGDGWIART